jgi:hypothetical protein
MPCAAVTSRALAPPTLPRARARALAEGLGVDGKPFVGTSGTLMLTLGGVERVERVAHAGTEDDTIDGGYRVDTENFVVGLAGRSIRASVLRLPPVVHSSLDKHGFVPTLIEIARAAGRPGYVGQGANRWPAAHTLDVARLNRLALEGAPAGSRLHAVDDDGIPSRQIAEAIGHNLGVPTASIPTEELEAHFGFVAFAVALDNPTTSVRTRELLGWKPTHPGLLANLDEGHCFTTA